MKITIINKNKKVVDLKDGTVFINITQKEAIRLIKSLSSQIVANSSNVDRVESYDDYDNYFSIGVDSNEI